VLSPDYPALHVPLRGAGPAVALWWPQGRPAAPDRLAALVRERLGGADLLSGPTVLVDLPWPRAPRGTQQIAIVRLPATAPPAPPAPAPR
jgi:hypothetical protein